MGQSRWVRTGDQTSDRVHSNVHRSGQETHREQYGANAPPLPHSPRQKTSIEHDTVKPFFVNSNSILLRCSSLEGLLDLEVSDINSSRSDFRLGVRFCAIGMGVASPEEFISQGVLKHTLFGWIIPAFIAFLPFLVTSALIHRVLQKKIKTKNHLELFYYIISGGIGLFVEWFLIGLSPWSSSSGTNPVLTAVFQLGIFSFWGSVAFAPRILVDRRTVVTDLVRWFKRFLAVGFVIIYLATFAANRQSQFATGIISILTIFLALNIFYFRYIRSWGSVVPAQPKLV